MGEVRDVPAGELPQRDDWDDSTLVAGPDETPEEPEAEAATEAVGGTAAGSAAVRRARTQLGVAETGSNCGIPHDRYVKWIAGPGAPCAPWCAYFVGWAFDTSSTGNKDHKAPWGTSGYVPWIWDWAARSGKVVRTPSHGDLFFLNPTDGSRSHIGLVAGADPRRHVIYTCEGNWGGRVLGQTRDYRAGDIRFARI